jgi:hypothetical protein
MLIMWYPKKIIRKKIHKLCEAVWVNETKYNIFQINKIHAL